MYDGRGADSRTLSSCSPASSDAGHIRTRRRRRDVAAKNVAPRASASEFIESSKFADPVGRLPHADEETPYTIKLASTKDQQGHGARCRRARAPRARLAGAAANQKNVICHELYVNDKDELYMVTMSRA